MLGDCPAERRHRDPGNRKKLRSRSGSLELFLYRLAAHHRIPNVEEWRHTVTIDQLRRWIAYYRIEPFGDEWRRSARAALIVAAAFGAKVEPESEEKFLPTYDPMRVMTEAEIMAELMKIPGAKVQAK